MASTSAQSSDNVPKSRFQTTVCLADWWLVKAQNDLQGTPLAVAGHTVGGKQPMRFFSCLPILKRFDVFTLETTDGICVIIKGLINKARSAENGFPSNICNHFIFGFPPYWKEYVEKCMVEESASLTDDPPHVGSCDNDLGSHDSNYDNNKRTNTKTKSSAVPMFQESEIVITNSEKTPNMSSSASAGKETFSGSIIEEDRTTQDIPVNCLKNTVTSVTSSTFGEKINAPGLINKDVDDSQIHESGGILSSCHLYTQSRSRYADDSMMKVKLGQKSSSKANFSSDIKSSELILTNSMRRVETRSQSRMKKKQKNDEASAAVSGGKKLMLNSGSSSMDSERVELACEDSGGGSENNLHFEVTELNESTDKTSLSELDDGSAKDKFEKIPETPNREKDLKKVKADGMMQKKNKATRSLSTPVAAENAKQTGGADERSFSEQAKAPNVNATRKLVYETPKRKKENVSTESLQSPSFKRSRSGRLLTPPLEFWRNQTAIYDADRTITGIEEGIRLEQPRKGSKSTPRRERRRRQPVKS